MTAHGGAAPGGPGFRVTNTCARDRYRTTKTLLTDPERDVLVQDTRFESLDGPLDAYRLFVLLAPHLGAQGAGNDAAALDLIPVRNRPAADGTTIYSGMASPDALALVHFGLRRGNDVRMLNTVRAIDALLRSETPTGPVWHRYTDDGYGEHDDGSPFDGTGIGRGWPLLAGERAHYELAAGNRSAAESLLAVLRRQTGLGGLMPEQIWDVDDIPDRELFRGCPTGSAIPLAWAHAEYVKLLRSLRGARVFDTPPQTTKRYIRTPRPCRRATWRFNNELRVMPRGRVLRVETRSPVVVHWSGDDRTTVQGTEGRDTGLGTWAADLDAVRLPAGAVVRFTFYRPNAGTWEGTDFQIRAAAPG